VKFSNFRQSNKHGKASKLLAAAAAASAVCVSQNVVEKQLEAEGVSRTSLGRDAFEERVWAWKEE
jgi:valyl-tRNA synthetase